MSAYETDRHASRPVRPRARRTSAARVVAMGEALSERQREIVDVVAKLGLVSHAQLAALTPTPSADASTDSVARGLRRLLAQLTEARILGRLERRIGGIRAGSAGYVYYLGPVGQRLTAYWEGRDPTRGRLRPEPGGKFVRHRLAVSQLYVDAYELHCSGLLDFVSFDVEPDCWQSFVDRRGRRFTLKPDAFLRVGIGSRQDQFFCEVDLASESRPVIARKLRTYVDFLGQHNVPTQGGAPAPGVVLLTTTVARQAVLNELCAGLPAEKQRLFAVGILDRSRDAIRRRTGIDPPSIGQ